MSLLEFNDCMDSFSCGWTVICVVTQKKTDRDGYLITFSPLHFTKTVMEWIADVFLSVGEVRG